MDLKLVVYQVRMGIEDPSQTVVKESGLFIRERCCNTNVQQGALPPGMLLAWLLRWRLQQIAPRLLPSCADHHGLQSPC